MIAANLAPPIPSFLPASSCIRIIGILRLTKSRSGPSACTHVKGPVAVMHVDATRMRMCRTCDDGGASAHTRIIMRAHVYVCVLHVCADPSSRLVKYTSVMHDTLLNSRDEVSRLLENARNLRRFPLQITRGRNAQTYTPANVHTYALLD